MTLLLPMEAVMALFYLLSFTKWDFKIQGHTAPSKEVCPSPRMFQGPAPLCHLRRGHCRQAASGTAGLHGQSPPALSLGAKGSLAPATGKVGLQA